MTFAAFHGIDGATPPTATRQSGRVVHYVLSYSIYMLLLANSGPSPGQCGRLQ